MSTRVTCPECDEKVTLRPGRSSVRCPACGSSITADQTEKGRRRADDDEEDDREKRPKRKYRDEWDDDDDDDDRRKPVSKPKGSLTWLWVLLGVLAVVIAGCVGVGVFVNNVFRKARDQVAQRAEQMKAEQQQQMNQMNARPGNPQGRPNPPLQQNAAIYPKTKRFDLDPSLLAQTDRVFLDDLSPFDVKQGDWPIGLHGALGFDDRWVCSNGQYFDHGIGMIPPNQGSARMSFATGGGARRLTGQVALNDYWHDGESHGAVTFAIYKDGKEVWRSQPMKKRKMPEAFDVDIAGARVITIETNAPASAHDAHCVWLDPVLQK